MIYNDAPKVAKSKKNNYEITINKPKKEITYNENMPNAAPDAFYGNNFPIKNSKLIDKIGELEIYLYPKIDFDKNEIKEAIKIMVLGPTGSGKTTLLNSYINYLMDLKYIDNFRYKIINEVKKNNDAHSQTSEVTSYNIRT